jgi:drug/metabolite transporter (DMT)-like permease
MSWRTLVGLILCNAIWATNPVMGKILLRDFSPPQVSTLRYGSALFMALILVALFYYRRPGELSSWRALTRPGPALWILAAALTTFFGSALVQYLGLAQSTSTANAIIVALEPLFAVFLAWIFLREKLTPTQMLAFTVAIAGFCLLSNVDPGDLSASLLAFSVGNLLLLFTMPMEAMYTIVSRKLAGTVKPVSLFAVALLLGFTISLTVSLAKGMPLPSLARISPEGWLALLWLGPVGTAITYIFWTVALVDAPVAAVSLTLFVQPILGAAAGMLFLGERLSLWQSVGGAMILVALFLKTQVRKGRHS